MKVQAATLELSNEEMEGIGYVIQVGLATLERNKKEQEKKLKAGKKSTLVSVDRWINAAKEVRKRLPSNYNMNCNIRD